MKKQREARSLEERFSFGSFSLPEKHPAKYIPLDKRRGRKKAMTVALGMVCYQGVLLAADTEITLTPGVGKYRESKIFPISRENGCYMAYCGGSDFAREFVDRLRAKERARETTALLETAKNEYQCMYATESRKPPEEHNAAEVLLTLRRDIREPFKEKLQDFKTSLYLLRGEHTFEISRYEVIGIGGQHAGIFEPLYSGGLSLRENLYLAIYGIQKVKNTMQGVGGPTEVIEIYNNDSLPFADFGHAEIQEIEEDFSHLERQLTPLLASFPSDISAKGFQQRLRLFGDHLKNRRKERKKKKG